MTDALPLSSGVFDPIFMGASTMLNILGIVGVFATIGGVIAGIAYIQKGERKKSKR